MTSAEVRQAFLDYFVARGHRLVVSSPLVPQNDSTLLFTNAGMVQFKEVFLGEEQRDYARAVSAQRCVRAGGKHNDLENVGYTARHHTFFEMLGNFSFGDYFKREAIRYAWEFLTEILRIPEHKLSVTVYRDDGEAAGIWARDIGLPADRITRLGEQDNFWSMGDIGPCGPCSEIFYDHGPEVPGGPPGSPDADGDRYIEIWNLVFMQYHRGADGELKPLPKLSVDTGMGLERIAAVLQGVHDNYDIDLFRGLVQEALALFPAADRASRSLRVIADHIRSSAFLIVDGVMPANEGRGYVLRRIIRRAVRHGVKLGSDRPFFYRLVAPLAVAMGDAYPELWQQRTAIEAALREEEERFARTLEQGLQLLDADLDAIQGGTIPGQTIFRLYDTYGFPVDLTADIAKERGLAMDWAGYEAAMAEQRDRARRASSFGPARTLALDDLPDTEFLGYDSLAREARILALFDADGVAREHLATGQEGAVVLEQTPFYAESGGQVGDRGVLQAGQDRFEVWDTRKQGQVWIHTGLLASGNLARGDVLQCSVDPDSRGNTALHHSATHLLHAALRQVLGDQVTQKGSLVEPRRLRFDFSHPAPVSADQLRQIQQLVNQQIRANHAVQTRITDMDDALRQGAMALFGEKYGERVRVLGMGEFSVELCGGTHVNRTGAIGFCKIVAESGVAAGVRRIEAVAGPCADAWIDLLESRLDELRGLLHATEDTVVDKARQALGKAREQERELAALKQRLAQRAGGELADRAVEVAGVRVLATQVENVDAKALRGMVDQLKQKLGSAVIVLAGVEGEKVSLVAGVSADLMARLKAGELVNMVATQVGGKGGGRPDLAMAGGNQPQAVPTALASVAGWVAGQLG